jgi:hypothetical protein
VNLPITPLNDLRVHKGNLIAATSGRSFWVLDDLSHVRQYKKETTPVSLYKPADAYLVSGSSELDGSNPKFDGTNTYRGVNPASGVVLYYRLPALKKTEQISLEVRNAAGKLIRTFSSKADPNYKRYDGGPGGEPLLPKSKGQNRFVWNMRYPTVPGVPNVYIEASYRGHKAIPGTYTYTLKAGGQSLSTSSAILANPYYPTTAATYQEYDTVMTEMETKVTKMHLMVNSLRKRQMQLKSLLGSLPADNKFSRIKSDGDALLKKMTAWDEDMVQRKSTAYDDVENFPNKFTADYMFLINQTESSIPRVNQPSLDLKQKLDAQWAVLEGRANEFMTKDIPALNKRLWDAGIGAIWKEE